jgi:hypothetical protein
MKQQPSPWILSMFFFRRLLLKPAILDAAFRLLLKR